MKYQSDPGSVRRVFPEDLRIGIAFEGGGAKGSFGWGVIEVLLEAGIKPVAVSGTSAGALSAVAVAAGKYSDGSRLYRNLRLADVLPFKANVLLALPMFAVSYASHACLRQVAGMNATHIEKDSAVANVAARLIFLTILLVSVGWMLSFYAEPDPRPQQVSNFQNIVVGSALLLMFGLIVVLGGRRLTHALFFLCLGWLGGYPIYQFIFGLGVKVFSSGGAGMDDLVVHLRGFLPIIVLKVVHVLAKLCSKITLSSNAPLRRHVEDLVKDGICIDCYAAVATAHEIFDPDNPVYDVVPSGIEGVPPEMYPSHVPTYVPEYFNLREVPTDEVATLAVASAALPFGIVRHETYKGFDYVDGGLADNCPVRPLIDSNCCEVLITIHLRPDAPLSDVERHYLETWRLSDLLESPFGCIANRSVELPEQEGLFVPYRELPRRFPIVFSVMPSIDLGGLLDFRKSAVEMRLAEGRRQGELLMKDLFEVADEYMALCEQYDGAASEQSD